MEKFLKDLHKLNIPNLPNSVEEFIQIEELDLSNQKIQRLPDEICELTNLKRLNLSYNEIDWLPRDFRKLKNLVKLGLCNNRRLASVDEIADLKNLQWLNISGSRNFELPSLANLQKLKTLYMQNTGAYERDIRVILEAENIEVLDISVNDFHNIDRLDELPNLKYFAFDKGIMFEVPNWLKNNSEWEYTINVVQCFYDVYIFRKKIN